MDADSMQRKLDCYLLTARISKEHAKEIKSVGKPTHNTELSKETLARILRIKRTEDRILTRLDYWIYGQLSNESSNERQIAPETSSGNVQAQTWDFNINSSKRSLSTERLNANGTGVNPRADRLVARSMSAAQSKSAKKTQKDRLSKSGKAQEKAESISMFNYNVKTDIDDDNISTGGILRRRMFSKFGTLNRRKLKMFFTRGNDENNDDRKSMKSFKSVKSSKEGNERRDSTETKASKIPSALRKFRKRNVEKEDRKDFGKTRQRPKSVASFDFDYENLPDQIADVAFSGTVDLDNNVQSGEVPKRKTLRERLRTMPVFYMPSSNKGQINVYK